jgi:hypothetical protein
MCSERISNGFIIESYTFMITCSVCSQVVTSKRGLAFHIKKHGIDSVKTYLEMFPEEQSNINPKDNSLLTCPICGEYNFKQLTQHITWKHNMTREQFEQQYPDQLLYLPEISERCSRAGTTSGERYQEHFEQDPEKYRLSYMKRAKTRKKNNPDLGKKISGILRSHGVYDRLSEQSKRLWKDDSYRKLQSDKCKRQHENGLTEIILKNSGKKRYKVTLGECVYSMRSKWECTFANILYEKHIPFEYESFCIKYEFNGRIRSYYPDFVIPNTNILFEVKPLSLTKKDINIAKMNACIEEGYDFRYITEIELKNPEIINFSRCNTT